MTTKTRWVISGLWALATVILAHYIDPHILLAGGGPCIIIITGGNGVSPDDPGGEDAKLAVEDFVVAHPTVKAGSLMHALEASCEGTLYASLYLQGEGGELGDSFTTPIRKSHKHIARQLNGFDPSGPAPQVIVDALAHELWSAVVHLRTAVG